MKKIFCFSYCFILLLNNLSAKTIKSTDSLRIIQQKNIELSNEIARLRNEIEYTKSLIQTGNGTISNQLSSSQSNLSSLGAWLNFISIVLVVAVPLVAWYITRLSNRMQNSLTQADGILTTISAMRAEVTEMQRDVNETQDTIRNNLSALYQSLKDEEIKGVFKRLEVEPLDISHFFPTLATAELSPNYFNNLIDVFYKLKGSNSIEKIETLILLCSRFPKETLKNKLAVDELKIESVSQGLYLGELKCYIEELCKCIENEKIDHLIEIFQLALTGTLSSNIAGVSVKSVLESLNMRLSPENKETLIKSLKKKGFIQFDYDNKNGELILKSK